MPVDVLTLPLSSMNTKWKEPYASASLNSKLTGIIAPGIYRGLIMAPDPLLGDRTVLVKADVDSGDHVAVYQNVLGYSVTYRDSTSGDITLSLSSYSNVTVIVCVYINYTPGVDTTGSFRVFTQAEFNVLSTDVRDALVILGTVNVPVSGVISSSNISLQFRTLASANLARGTILNAPLVRNPGFELGETNATYAQSSIFWDKSFTVGTGVWRTSTALVNTGMKSIEFSITAGPVTGDLSQQMGIETAEGELFLISVVIKQLKTISSGTLVFFADWADVNDSILSTTTMNLDGGGIDANFRTVNTIIAAPAGAVMLRAVGIRATLLSPSSTGIFAYIDNVDVSVEPRDPTYPYPFDQAFRRQLRTTKLGIEDATGGFSTGASSMRHDSSSPASEGKLVLESNNSGNLPPALGLLGRIFQLGASLLGTEPNALKPRISADISTAVGVDFTLMWESARQGETTGLYTQPVVRLYSSSDGKWLMTSNAIWGGTSWGKDVPGQGAYKWSLAKDGVRLQSHVIDGTWTDSAWEDTLQIQNPLSTNVDSLTARISMGAFNGTGSDLTQLCQFVYSAHKIRIYAADSGAGGSISLMITVNARWDGTNWNKDTAADMSMRLATSLNMAGTGAYPSAMAVRYDIRDNSTATFPDTGWSDVGTSSSTPSSGGIIEAGQAWVGTLNSSTGPSNPQARLSIVPDYGGLIGSGNERMEPYNLIDAGNFHIDAMGNWSPQAPHIFEEFHQGLPSGWSSIVSGTGVVNSNTDGLSRLQFSSGTGTAGIRTSSTVVIGAYASFNCVVRWDNVTGSSYFGIIDGSANKDFGFVQDSGTYGDEKLRLILRTGGGTQVLNTNLDVSTKTGDWFYLHAYAAGGTGLITTTRVCWRVQGKITRSDVFNPGAAIINPSTACYAKFEANSGGLVTIDRVMVSGMSNFSL